MQLRAIALSCSILCGFVGVVPTPASSSGDLQPRTLRAFEQYAAATERRVRAQMHPQGDFLYLDTMPAPERRRIFDGLRRGEMFMEPLETRGPGGGAIDIPDGLVHHWLGAVFIPGVSVHKTLALVQDYDHHATVYRPAVDASRILQRNGNDFTVFMRFRKKKVITVVMDTVHSVTYVTPAPDRTYSFSRTTSVREVQDAGTADEHILEDGQGSGFLWRINSYWRFIERDGGTYVECESISLTRTIPFMLRWLVGPFVNDVPREQLAELLQTTRRTLEDR